MTGENLSETEICYVSLHSYFLNTIEYDKRYHR
jgi:hypothetical protein